jgi:DNA-binding MarR family transcriptional regulator
MLIKQVYEAFSLRSDHALSEALSKLQRQLIDEVQTLGPAAVAFQLQGEQTLTQILNRIQADASATPSLHVAFLAGFIRACADYLAVIVDRHEVDAANARLSTDGDEDDQADSIRMMILKAAFAHAGARAKELVSVVARLANVTESSVKFHLKKLVALKLVERLELSPKAVSYRISPLGEAVLARRSKPHELALFVIDEASSDVALRAAIRNEIEIAWLDEDIRRPDEQRAVTKRILPFPGTSRVAGSDEMGSVLSDLHNKYQRKQRKVG